MRILSYIPTELSGLLENTKAIEEIRIRADKPARVKIGQQWFYFGKSSLQKSPLDAVSLSALDVQEILGKICDKSIYTFENQLVNGFLTLSDGTRIGVGGNLCMDGDFARCFSEYTSLCVRVPHFVEGHGKSIFSLMEKSPKNCLIVGQPATGKTTLLRELSVLLSSEFNVVVIDERGEITLCEGFSKLSKNIDTLLFASKQFGLTTAVRSLSPEVLVCDEIVESDIECVKTAISKGVAVCASIHGKDLDVAKALQDKGVFFDFYCILNKNYQISPQVFEKSLKMRVL